MEAIAIRVEAIATSNKKLQATNVSPQSVCDDRLKDLEAGTDADCSE